MLSVGKHQQNCKTWTLPKPLELILSNFFLWAYPTPSSRKKFYWQAL